MDNFFAVDLGATSGRTILGSIQDGKLSLREMTRFPNNILQTGGNLYWDIFALYNEIIRGLKVVADEGITIRSIGIDTWGVDFVCIGNDGNILRNPYSYRDPQTQGMVEKFKTLVEQNATLGEVNEWGKRRLAYPINHKNEGYYVLMTFESKTDFPAELTRIYNITDGIIRAIVVEQPE